jgi:hypothetical protein
VQSDSDITERKGIAKLPEELRIFACYKELYRERKKPACKLFLSIAFSRELSCQSIYIESSTSVRESAQPYLAPVPSPP